METMFTAIVVAFITAVLGPVIIELVKNFFSKKSNISPMKEAIDLNKAVDDQIEILLDEMECDRIWISQFHNGGHFYPTGKSIQKFSLFYEKVSDHTDSIQHTLQNIPVSLFPKALSELYKNGEIKIVDFETDELYGLEVFGKEYGCQSLYLLEIDDLNGHFIGIIGISYNKEKYSFTKEDWMFVRQKVGAIGSLLTNYLNKK